MWIKGGRGRRTVENNYFYANVKILKTVGLQTVSSTIYSKRNKKVREIMLISVPQSQAQFLKLKLAWNTDTEVFNKLEIVVIYFLLQSPLYVSVCA